MLDHGNALVASAQDFDINKFEHDTENAAGLLTDEEEPRIDRPDDAYRYLNDARETCAYSRDGLESLLTDAHHSGRLKFVQDDDHAGRADD